VSARRRSRRLLALGTLTTLAFVVLAALAATGTSTVDHEVHEFVRESAPKGSLTHVTLSRITPFGSGYVLVPLVVVLFFVLRPIRPDLASLVAAAPLGGALLQVIVKDLIDRPRPNQDPDGFPSGHTLGVVVVLGVLLYVLWALERRAAWRWTAVVFCVAMVGVMGYSRMQVNAHWVTDVAGGLVGGVAYLALVLAWFDARFGPVPVVAAAAAARPAASSRR